MDTNPGNFANRPKEEVQTIASMGGKAAHEKAEHAKEVAAKDSKEASPVKDTPNGNESRNPDGTFKKSSPEAAQAGHLGGLHAAGKEDTHPGRREDGTFLPGSKAAKEASHKGGEVHAAHGASGKDDTHPGRREDGTFLPRSEAAKEAGHKGGEVRAAHVAAEKN